MIEELQNRLQGLEWNAANADHSYLTAVKMLERWKEEVVSRRLEAGRHLAALVEFKRSHASPAIIP